MSSSIVLTSYALNLDLVFNPLKIGCFARDMSLLNQKIFETLDQICCALRQLISGDNS